MAGLDNLKGRRAAPFKKNGSETRAKVQAAQKGVKQAKVRAARAKA